LPLPHCKRNSQNYSTLNKHWQTYFEMVLEFESFLTLRTLELAKHCTLIVAYHVALQAVNICKCLVAHFAGLLAKTNTDI